jgi:hypothetical protein
MKNLNNRVKGVHIQDVIARAKEMLEFIMIADGINSSTIKIPTISSLKM